MANLSSRGERMGNERIKIKYMDLLDLLKHHLGDIIFKEALEHGQIEVVDDTTGQVIQTITLDDVNF